MKYIRLSGLNSFFLLLLTSNHLVYRSLLDTETKSLLTSADRFSSFLPLEHGRATLFFDIGEWKLVNFRFDLLYIPSEGILSPIISSQSNEHLKYQIEFYKFYNNIYIYIFSHNCSIYRDNRYSPIIYNTRLSSPSPILAALHPHATGNYINTRPIT